MAILKRQITPTFGKSVNQLELTSLRTISMFLIVLIIYLLCYTNFTSCNVPKGYKNTHPRKNLYKNAHRQLYVRLQNKLERTEMSINRIDKLWDIHTRDHSSTIKKEQINHI